MPRPEAEVFLLTTTEVRHRVIPVMGTPRFFVLALVLLLPGLALADASDDAWVAYNRGDYKTAASEFRKLADQGDASAQYNLGVMYYEGEGVPQDYEEAARWYRKAADQGNAKAQHNLGWMYTNGQGVPLDYEEAVRWYRKAADQGDVRAQSNLGLMYAGGRGVPQDYVKAYMWFILASVDGNEVAISNRNAIEKRLKPAQIAEAQKMAKEWKGR